MDEFGRKSNGQNDWQLEIYQGNNSRNDLRTYSVNSSHSQPNFYNNFDGQFPYDFDRKLKRAKTATRPQVVKATTMAARTTKIAPTGCKNNGSKNNKSAQHERDAKTIETE